jgi:hypothetical protein
MKINPNVFFLRSGRTLQDKFCEIQHNYTKTYVNYDKSSWYDEKTFHLFSFSNTMNV